MDKSATITVMRPPAVSGAIRMFRVLCDGVEVAKVANNSSVTMSLSPGRHALQVKFDWLGGKPLKVTLEPGQDRHFVCGTPDDVGQSLLAMVGLPNSYLRLRAVSSSERENYSRSTGPSWGRATVYCAVWLAVVALFSAVLVGFIMASGGSELEQDFRMEKAGNAAGILLVAGWAIILLWTYTKRGGGSA